tara:strand:- start:1262 stop:2413 length:1152 start_codon:yes stop_codon:yes gene_type:complete
MFKVKQSQITNFSILAVSGVSIIIYLLDFALAEFDLKNLYNQIDENVAFVFYWPIFVLASVGAFYSFYRTSTNKTIFEFNDEGIIFSGDFTFSIQWNEIDKIQLGYHSEGLFKDHHLVITPKQEKIVKEHNDLFSLDLEADSLSQGWSWNMQERIGLPLNNLDISNEELLWRAKKILTEGTYNKKDMFEVKAALLPNMILAIIMGFVILGSIGGTVAIANPENIAEIRADLGPLVFIISALAALALFCGFIWLFIFALKRAFGNEAILIFDQKSIVVRQPMQRFSISWQDIAEFHLLHHKISNFAGYGSYKTSYLIITPKNTDLAKKINHSYINNWWRNFSQLKNRKLFPWDVEKRIGVTVNGLKIKPKEILEIARKILSEKQ